MFSHSKIWSIVVAAMLAASCSIAADEAAEMKARNDSELAALRRIAVTRGSEVSGQSSLVRLGRVQGYCDRDVERQDSAVSGDSLRQAAYRRYGDKVDAIVETNTWFVVDGTASMAWATEGGGGHFECAGIAVTFEKS
ncbi:MAG: hypothetical protein ACREQF_01165 [Candidatus Binataceae bacterium]